MVKLRKSLSVNHGIGAWLQQRLTAVIMLISLFIFFVFMLLGNEIIDSHFITWHQFFSFLFVKIIVQITIAAVILHAWIGMRDIVMDYIKCYGARVTFYTIILLWLFGSLIYSVAILWA